MGEYVYKVTRHRVELSNGEEANVAVFAYKPTFNPFGGTSNEQMHVRSGAAKCDAGADTRSDWIVQGYYNSDTRKIEVDIESEAKHVGRRGSYSDSWFDMKDAETSAVAAALSREIELHRTEIGQTNEGLDEYVNYVFDRRRGWVERGRHSYRSFDSAA